jgi:hypothetical protein
MCSKEWDRMCRQCTTAVKLAVPAQVAGKVRAHPGAQSRGHPTFLSCNGVPRPGRFSAAHSGLVEARHHLARQDAKEQSRQEVELCVFALKNAYGLSCRQERITFEPWPKIVVEIGPRVVLRRRIACFCDSGLCHGSRLQTSVRSKYRHCLPWADCGPVSVSRETEKCQRGPSAISRGHAHAARERCVASDVFWNFGNGEHKS